MASAQMDPVHQVFGQLAQLVIDVTVFDIRLLAARVIYDLDRRAPLLTVESANDNAQVAKQRMDVAQARWAAESAADSRAAVDVYADSERYTETDPIVQVDRETAALLTAHPEAFCLEADRTQLPGVRADATRLVDQMLLVFDNLHSAKRQGAVSLGVSKSLDAPRIQQLIRAAVAQLAGPSARAVRRPVKEGVLHHEEAAASWLRGDPWSRTKFPDLGTMERVLAAFQRDQADRARFGALSSGYLGAVESREPALAEYGPMGVAEREAEDKALALTPGPTVPDLGTRTWGRDSRASVEETRTQRVVECAETLLRWLGQLHDLFVASTLDASEWRRNCVAALVSWSQEARDRMAGRFRDIEATHDRVVANLQERYRQDSATADMAAGTLATRLGAWHRDMRSYCAAVLELLDQVYVPWAADIGRHSASTHLSADPETLAASAAGLDEKHLVWLQLIASYDDLLLDSRVPWGGPGPRPFVPPPPLPVRKPTGSGTMELSWQEHASRLIESPGAVSRLIDTVRGCSAQLCAWSLSGSAAPSSSSASATSPGTPVAAAPTSGAAPHSYAQLTKLFQWTADLRRALGPALLLLAQTRLFVREARDRHLKAKVALDAEVALCERRLAEWRRAQGTEVADHKGPEATVHPVRRLLGWFAGAMGGDATSRGPATALTAATAGPGTEWSGLEAKEPGAEVPGGFGFDRAAQEHIVAETRRYEAALERRARWETDQLVLDQRYRACECQAPRLHVLLDCRREADRLAANKRAQRAQYRVEVFRARGVATRRMTDVANDLAADFERRATAEWQRTQHGEAQRRDMFWAQWQKRRPGMEALERHLSLFKDESLHDPTVGTHIEQLAVLIPGVIADHANHFAMLEARHLWFDAEELGRCVWRVVDSLCRTTGAKAPNPVVQGSFLVEAPKPPPPPQAVPGPGMPWPHGTAGMPWPHWTAGLPWPWPGPGPGPGPGPAFPGDPGIHYAHGPLEWKSTLPGAPALPGFAAARSMGTGTYYGPPLPGAVPRAFSPGAPLPWGGSFSGKPP